MGVVPYRCQPCGMGRLVFRLCGRETGVGARGRIGGDGCGCHRHAAGVSGSALGTFATEVAHEAAISAFASGPSLVIDPIPIGSPLCGRQIHRGRAIVTTVGTGRILANCWNCRSGGDRTRGTYGASTGRGSLVVAGRRRTICALCGTSADAVIQLSTGLEKIRETVGSRLGGDQGILYLVREAFV